MDTCLRTFLLLQAVASNIVVTRGQYVLEGCMESKSQTAQLSCGKGCIFSVYVLSGTSNCTKSGDGCAGKTPSLLVDQLNCHWRSNCVIDWPRDPIIMTVKEGTCFGSYSTSVMVSYKCVQPTDYQIEGSQNSLTASGSAPRVLLADICSNLDSGTSVHERYGMAYQSGIIRSHKFYPWGYLSGQRNCSMKIYWPENQKLVITVQNIDLDEDDSLIVGNKNPLLVTGGTFDFTNEEITFFNFSVGNESTTGEGFVLCFKFMAVEDKTSADVCETLTTTGSVRFTENKDAQTVKMTAVSPSKVMTTTLAPPMAVTELPERCQKKKSARAKKRCAKKMAAKKKNNGGKGRKNGRRRKGKPKGEKGRDKKKRRKKQN